MAYRAYEPCLGCATHALPGRVALQVSIRDVRGRVPQVLRSEPPGGGGRPRLPGDLNGGGRREGDSHVPAPRRADAPHRHRPIRMSGAEDATDGASMMTEGPVTGDRFALVDGSRTRAQAAVAVTGAARGGTLVVGLGNPILGNDGVGWRVAEGVRARIGDS